MQAPRLRCHNLGFWDLCQKTSATELPAYVENTIFRMRWPAIAKAIRRYPANPLSSYLVIE